MSDPAIKRIVTAAKGRYILEHDTGGFSELGYSILSPVKVIADHTEVEEGHEGEGIGMLLLAALLADARAEGFKIVPLCPFINAQRRKHPAWADLFDV